MEPDLLEHILDGREKQTNLPLEFLKKITLNFSKEREVGHGGFATVYKGVLPTGNVAVKRIRNSHTIDEKLFYGEVNSLLTVNHPNIVRFLGFCASTDQRAIKVEGKREHIYAEIRERLLCFEYISNGNLQKHITDELRGLEWSTRYQLIKGICNGLHYLHMEKHIYHMDLKPANILLDNDMVPKITDFGLSRLDEKSQTMSVERHGTLGYCAPEYLHCGKMSFKSDIYSLGTIIIELVTGEKSIPDNNKNNALRRWKHRWRKTGKETPLGYQQVIKCIDIGLLCQEIDPCKRPFIWEIVRDINELEGTYSQISNDNESAVGQISPYSEDDMLGIEPLELHFPFELDKQMSCLLELTNDTDSHIAFEVQKMSPLLYCTEPHEGIVPPHSTCCVDITLQAQHKAPQRANEFIVRSTRVNNGFTTDHIATTMFSKYTGNVVDEVNLDVVFDQVHTEPEGIVAKVPKSKGVDWFSRLQFRGGLGRLQIIKNDDLEYLQELGPRNYGTVYHGKWRGSDVAIKRINDECFTGNPSKEDKLRNDFWNEASNVADLQHPNVVAFYGVVLDGPGESIATVTEYMVNGSLWTALLKNSKSLDRQKRLIIAMDIAFGMEYLHNKSIVHFDLTSENLLVNLRDPQRPICKVGDLGLSEVMCENLVSGGVKGTLQWMAPELLSGSSSLVSEKVDVFSFGIVLWELLTGEIPYAHLHYGTVIGGIVNNTLRPQVPDSCEPEWRSLMEQCWATEPSARPSFTQIAVRLRSMAASQNMQRGTYIQADTCM